MVCSHRWGAGPWECLWFHTVRGGEGRVSERRVEEGNVVSTTIF